MNKERLLNVAKALRESPDPEGFDMGMYGHGCGTPACAWGHYCARADLQSEFRLDKSGYPTTVEGADAGLGSYEIERHFDLGRESNAAAELFFPEGCGNAKTAIEAAEYIERFVAEHEVKS